MRVMLIIKVIAGLLVIAAMIGTLLLMKEFSGAVGDMPGTMMEVQRQHELALKKKAEDGLMSNNEPGEKAFQRAAKLLEEGSLKEAEEKLKYIVSFYPIANSAQKARQILGEINMDRLLDPEWKEGKKKISVQKGDNYSALIKSNKTTMDSLVHLSQLKDTDSRSLRPGKSLTVMPLDMRVIIDLRKKNLTVMNGGDYVKEYAIKEVNYKPKEKSKHLQLGSIRGWYQNKSITIHSPNYREATKVIHLSDKSLAIRALTDDTDTDFSRGFYLSVSDMEELPLILRPGNDIEIKN